MTQQITDQLNRPLHDLRISVIDRCNFRCPYCMPEQKGEIKYKFLEQNEWLTFDEIARLARIFTRVGVKKLRLTGGEPLLRPDIHLLIQELTKIKGIEDLALTTNASLLKPMARTLKQAGLQRLTVSLDTLDSRIFKLMSGQRGSMEGVLEGIQEAKNVGFKNIKINCVVQKGVNDHKILDLIAYFKNSGHILRFIEYMDVGTCNHWDKSYVVPNREILKLIGRHYSLKPAQSNYWGEVARRYIFDDGGEVGFISSVSEPFCGSCTRARLTAEGRFVTCLFAKNGFDLGRELRNGKNDQEILECIKNIWQKRDDRYSEMRHEILNQKNTVSKIEMFQIGG